MLTILWLLRSRSRMTARQLAAALETSVRTIYRYIDSLSASGVPIVAVPGHAGGYSLDKGFQAAPLDFTPTELKVMVHATRFAEQGGYPHSEVLERVFLKVMTTLPPSQAEKLERDTAAITVLPAPQGGLVEPWLEPLERAVTESATFRLTYQKLEQVSGGPSGRSLWAGGAARPLVPGRLLPSSAVPARLPDRPHSCKPHLKLVLQEVEPHVQGP